MYEWYFKSDTAEFEFDYTNKIKLKTLIDKIPNLTKFSIFFSSSLKPLNDLKYLQDLKDPREKFTFGIDLLIGDGPLILFFSALPSNNHENSNLDVSMWQQNYEDQKGRYGFHVTLRIIGWQNESSGDTWNIILFSLCRVKFWVRYVLYECPPCLITW